MEALKSEENAEEIAHRIRDLQQQWRQAADVPRAQSDALWQRFKKAHDEVWARCEAHFAAEAVTRDENLKKKIALCERVEALGDSTRWIQTADEIKTLQAEWKTIGPVSRGQEKAVWERFRAACDRFFSRRHDDLAQRKMAWAENFAKKEALCVQVEALADSIDWEPAAADIKRLQAEWKTIGPVKKSRSEVVWQRFRTACDRFFARYAQRHEIARGERVAAREAICAEVEAAASNPPESDASPAEAPAELLGRVRSLRARWQQEIAARGVEPGRAAELDRRFAAAFEQLRAARPEVFAGTDLDPEANRQRMEAIVVSRREARGVAARIVVGRRRGAVADDATRGHAQGSAGLEHDRREGGRGQPRARRTGRCTAGAGQLVANRSRAGRRAARIGGSFSTGVPADCRGRSDGGHCRPGANAMTGAGRPSGASGRPGASGKPGGASRN